MNGFMARQIRLDVNLQSRMSYSRLVMTHTSRRSWSWIASGSSGGSPTPIALVKLVGRSAMASAYSMFRMNFNDSPEAVKDPLVFRGDRLQVYSSSSSSSLAL